MTTRQPKAAPRPEKAPLSSQLDSIETTVPSAIPETFRHWREQDDPEEYRAAAALISHVCWCKHPQTIQNFQNCGTLADIYFDEDTGNLAVLSNHCHQRWCPLCAAARRTAIDRIARDWLLAAPSPSFITLTLSHDPAESLAQMLTRLARGFRSLRRLPRIKQILRGGIWFLQVKRGRDSNWHAHLHIAADSDYIPKSELSNLWRHASGGSYIVDIKRIHDPAKVAQYVARYVAKPARLCEFSFPDQVDLYYTMHGKRTYGKFGTAAQLDFHIPEPPIKSTSIKLGSFAALVKCIRSGLYEFAGEIWSSLRSGRPLPRTFDPEPAARILDCYAAYSKPDG